MFRFRPRNLEKLCACSWSACGYFSFHLLTVSSHCPLHLWGQMCPEALTTHFRSLDVRITICLNCKGLIFQFSDEDDYCSPSLVLLYKIVGILDSSFFF